MQFATHDERIAPPGLEPKRASAILRPPEYYKAVQQQKLALSSLSLVAGNRHADGFLKAGSSAKTRLQFAQANRSAKQYAMQST